MIEEREKLFGADLRLEERVGGMDLLPDSAGDLALARGNDNIVQALTMRLKVRRGELAPLGWAEYGSRLHELIGEPNIPRTRLKLMAFARQAVEADPRVLEISDVRAQVLTGERDTVRLLMEVRLISEPTPLNLIHDLVLEQA